MTSQPKPPKSEQGKRFVDAAREAGASESEDVFDETLRRIAEAPPPDTVQERKKPKTKKPAK